MSSSSSCTMCSDGQFSLPQSLDKMYTNSNSSTNMRVGASTRRRSSQCLLPAVTLLAILSLAHPIHGWGGNSNSNSGKDTVLFGNTFARDWLYDASSISIKVEGCSMGVVEDQDEFGCLEDESEDGTTNWYMMANCVRPQVVFSVYASGSSSTNCNSNNFKESVSKYKYQSVCHWLL